MIEAKGAALRYEIAGVGEPIVVLHGGPGIGFDYLAPELTQLFSDRFQLVLYDQRGSGQSTGAADPTLLNIEAFVDDVECVFRALGLERAILMGHSFGGLLALHCAIRNPERVKGLVLVESDPASKALWSRFTEVVERRANPSSAAAEIAAIQATDGWRAKSELVARHFELALRSYFFADSTIPPGFWRPVYGDESSESRDYGIRGACQFGRVGFASVSPEHWVPRIACVWRCECLSGRGHWKDARGDPRISARSHRGHFALPFDRVAEGVRRGSAGVPCEPLPCAVGVQDFFVITLV
jgi:pimeloyl-ACP methyl ester carboxylesterase